ncbi:MAG: hypothetical protein NDI62_03025 [Burkholderiales bacterium]|nr:hypothetical protein [Burkholderiales bacterium]
MKASIKNLIAQSLNGLLEMKPSLTIAEYRDGSGFGLKNIFTIYESKQSHNSGNNWFAFPNKTIETLFTIQEESETDLLIVYIVEIIKEDHVYCHLILTDEAFKEILNDKTQHILQVHQMYTQFLPFDENNVAINFHEEDEKDFSQPDFEMDMLRATLMLNPENLELSSEEMDRLVAKEYKESL